MLHKIYTWGYQGKQMGELVGLVNKLGAVPADIRYSPFSRNVTWNKAELQLTFGDKYHWIRALGNVNYKGDGPITIANWDVGTTAVGKLLEVSPVILICVCKDVEHCHRKVVGEGLAERFGVALEHLGVVAPNQSKWV